jgi:hypothetical protein
MRLRQVDCETKILQLIYLLEFGVSKGPFFSRKFGDFAGGPQLRQSFDPGQFFPPKIRLSGVDGEVRLIVKVEVLAAPSPRPPRSADTCEFFGTAYSFNSSIQDTNTQEFSLSATTREWQNLTCFIFERSW